jgi:RND family efflux transporter MFP subunit
MAALLGLVGSGLLVAAGCGGGGEHHAAGGTSEPVEVEIAVAEPSTVPRWTEASGSVRPWVRVAPGTKILGRVERVAVREGDRVAQGDLLAALEKRDLEAAVEQSRAAVAMAEANLENAQAQHRRMEELHGRGSATEKNLEDARAAWRVAGAALEQARAKLAAAEVTLGYAEIRSPVAGWVVSKHVEAGDMAAPGAPLFVVEDLSRVKVVLEVPETEVVGLNAGDAATVRVDVLERSWEATADRVVPSGDRASRTYEVQLVLPNPEGTLKSGMFARARFARGTRQAQAVDRSSLVRRGQLDGLFVVSDDGLARLRWVRVRPLEGDRVEVLSGLSPGERYVLAPPLGLADATPVVAR